MTEYWIWLSQIPYVGPVTANRLLRAFESPERIYHTDMQEIAERCRITQKQCKMIADNRSLDQAHQIMEQCRKLDIRILTIADELYDVRAKNDEAPIVLYYRGRLGKLHSTVGIVGARRCTREARLAAIECAIAYSERDTTVISGMAKGIDAYAHTACLNSGGRTIAFLAHGLDLCYPKEHNVLMQAIMESGAVLSEHPPGTRPSSYLFPQRNRLIGAWSDEVIVVGAGRGSGALITAEYAWKYKKSAEFLESEPMINY